MSLIINNIKNFFLREERKVRFFFIVFYSIGIFGIVTPLTRNLFISLTPFVLLMSFFALLVFHQPRFEKKSVIIFTSIYLMSYLIEVSGVRSGIVFGDYRYGNGLGIKVLDMPLMIGINWVLLVYCTAVMVERLPILNIIKVVLSSLMMVLYDIIMEQVAPQLDMWNFEGGIVPLRNYISWFIIAFLFHSLLKLTGVKIMNRLAAVIFYCQALFFMVLIIFFKLAE